MTPSKMGKLSVEARRKKHGGKRAFKKHMRAIAALPRRKRSLDKAAIPKRNAPND